MPRNEDHGPGDGLMQVGEDLGFPEDATKLKTFDDITKTLEHLLAATVSGKATKFQIDAATAIVEKAGRTLQAKATFQKQLESLTDQGMTPVLDEQGKLLALPTLLTQRTGTPYRRQG